MAEVDIGKIMEALGAAARIAPVGTSELIAEKVNDLQQLPVERLRIEAQASIERAERFYLESERRIHDVIKRAEQDGRRGRILQFLQLAILFFSTAQAVHQALAKDPKLETSKDANGTTDAANSDSELGETAQQPQASTGQSEYSDTGSEGGNATDDLVLGEWSKSDSVAAKHQRIEALISAAKAISLEGLDPRSADLTLAEQYLEEAFAIFNTLEPTEADIFFQENRLTIGKELASAALPFGVTNKDGKIRIKFKPARTILSLLKSALKPQALADGTIYGETGRQDLFRQLNSAFQRVLDWRAKGLGLDVSPLEIMLQDIEKTMECIDTPCMKPLP